MNLYFFKMDKQDDFYIGYSDQNSKGTRNFLKKVVWGMAILVVGVAAAFSLSQKKFANSTFELTSETALLGVYHESPYPMLRVRLENNTYKNIVLLGFGKFGANKYLDELRAKEGSLVNKTLAIEGNLIYYNGKTLLQITDANKIKLKNQGTSPESKTNLVGTFELEGEIVDPKCYFGVMKPGYGKIHRSCAALCISGGIPPVFVTTDQNEVSEYFLITDLEGKPLHSEVVPFIGQPSKIKGNVHRLEDWYCVLK